jgi:hypothetical protein
MVGFGGRSGIFVKFNKIGSAKLLEVEQSTYRCKPTFEDES